MARSPWMERALEVLADGEWHPYREVIVQIGSTVPPHIAIRRAEYARKEVAQRKGYRSTEARLREIESIELMRIGQAIIARNTLGNKVRFEIDPPGVMTQRGLARRVRLRRHDETHDQNLRPTRRRRERG